ncbi:MAG: rhamnulokinase [Bacteroidales bacterium]|nr:rhamnulokinase [Bacteroidales bacterium]
MNFLGVDLGATSGRTILGTIGNDSIKLREINRFPNPMIEVNGHLYWDIFALYQQIINGLKIVAEEDIEIKSIGIDAWGVDFVCIGNDGELLRQPYCYRDSQTVGAQEKFFKQVSRNKIYEKTGIQFMDFNTLFQLSTIGNNHSSILPITNKILFIPDALSYMLTGEMVTEYTIASTSQLIDSEKKTFDLELLAALDLTENSFGKLVKPGTVIGNLNETVKKLTGLGDIPVVAVAGHDTASAVVSVPSEDREFAYLSSGTWSLMGIEADKPIINDDSFSLNFTNEGGVDGTIRFLKNICGMWLFEQCRKEWNDNNSYEQLIANAGNEVPFRCFINPDATCFTNPLSITEAIRKYCEATSQYIPQTKSEITRCIFESLALRYKQVLDNLQQFASFPIKKLHVIGGGSKNDLLNRFTASALGIPVIAGPTEATTIGNLMLQAKTAGLYPDIQSMRKSISRSVPLTQFNPENHSEWMKQYPNYLSVFKEII